MKLIIDEFEALARRKGFQNGYRLWRRIGGGVSAYKLVKQGYRVTHEVIKELFNLVGEKETVRVVEFEEETINGLKAKYIEIGNKLY